MSERPGDEPDEAWCTAFEEARFPALVMNAERGIVRVNRAGRAYMERDRIIDVLKEAGAPALPVPVGVIAEASPVDGILGAVLLGLKGGHTLVCLTNESSSMVADYVRLYRALLHTSESLRRKSDRLEVYHEILTHDAPNFITAVYGYLQMMQGKELPQDKLQKYVDASIRQTESLNHLIDTARSLRQLETTPLGATSPLDLRDAVEGSISAVLSTSHEKPLTVKDDIPPGRYMVNAEAGLKEVFDIILDNAVRYSDSPQVGVELYDTGRCWHLAFADNGRGIPDDKKEFLFLRFDRLDKQKKIRGSGLSLALARALVERHGGKIWVENRVAEDYTKGSVFHILLPKA